MRKCRWKCGGTTRNKSGICTGCWKAAEFTRSLTDHGYEAWIERKRAKMALPPNPNRQAAGKKAAASRVAKLEQESRVAGLSGPGTENAWGSSGQPGSPLRQ